MMSGVKIVIVGGVAGGMSAATRLRRLDESADIIVFERSGYVSFANCGLPYYVGGVIEERSSLLLQTPESLQERFNLDVRVAHEVVSIDRAAKTVRVRNLAAGTEFDEAYDSLVLSPGASPFIPQMDGAERALPLRNVEDVDKLDAHLAAIEAKTERRAAIIMGAGFIGLEVAENLVHRGWQAIVVELADQIMTPLDPEMAAMVQNWLEAKGVAVGLGMSVTAIGEDSVTLNNGMELPADLVISAIGVRPDSQLAANAGLEVSDRGGIVVDEQQRTSDPSIFAVGDAVVKRDFNSGAGTMVPLANPANRHGRLVADVIVGADVKAAPVMGTAIVGLFGMQAASVGWNEKRARAEGRAIRVIHTHASDHAGYYPGAVDISLKLVVDAETDDILGAQGIGDNGIDKRIDIIATAMRGGIKASDLTNLELCYAPPFGSAKDPVMMLGFMNENVRDGVMNTIQWHELDERLEAGAQLVDVRTPYEAEHMPIPGCVNVPLEQMRDRIDEIQEGAVFYCLNGQRAYIAARIAAGHGKNVLVLDGGYRTWARY